MEPRSIHSEYMGKSSSKNLQIRLLGHCIICLRKVSINRKRSECETSDSFRTDVGGNSASPLIAPKSVVTTPGFLTTFNQLWAVLQLKRKETNGKTCSSNQTEISLGNVLQNDGCVSTNVSFSRAPTICRYCCDKVLMVENLMKAVRQQVRELSMLWEEGRRRQDGGLGELEKSLRENGLEECVIKATLQFVGIFDSSRHSEDDCKGDQNNAETVNVLGTECDEENNLTVIDSLIDADKNDNEDQIGLSEDEDGDGDPDYLITEPEDDDDDNESEDEMDVDSDDKNDADFKLEKDPLTPNTLIKVDHSSKKFPCSCGKSFASLRTRRDHISKNKETHPEYKLYGRVQANVRQTCELCGEKVLSPDILEHLRDHLNGKDEWAMRCLNEKCLFKCVSSKEYITHLRNDSSKQCMKIWKEKCGPVCEICGFKGTNMLKIRNHVRDKHENGQEKKWKCPISDCGKMFFVKQSVQEHLHEHRYRPPITEQVCDQCGESLKVEGMEGHLKDKHGVNEVIGCKQCELKFSGQDEMIEHLYEHRVVGISCDICGDKQEKFRRYSSFREHYFAVHKLCPKKYRCGEEDCDLWFWRKETKEEHELRMHRESIVSIRYRQTLAEGKGKGRKDFECDVCNVKFVKEDNLISHKIKFHGADPFKCGSCGETFVYKKQLTKHRREHAGIVFQKEWKCEVEGCGKIFKKKNLWKHHMEVGHGGQRSHICEECGKGFTFAASLKKHRETVHLGLRPYVCDECGESFGSWTTLNKHKLIHTGERPFGCDICGQRFRHKGVLKTHVKGHQEKGDSFKPNGPMKQIRKRKGQ